MVITIDMSRFVKETGNMGDSSQGDRVGKKRRIRLGTGGTQRVRYKGNMGEGELGSMATVATVAMVTGFIAVIPPQD